MNPVIETNGHERACNNFHLPLTYQKILIMEPTSILLVRYNGRWVTLHPRPFEPERMTTDIAWMQIKENITAEEAYRRWFELQRRISRVLK